MQPVQDLTVEDRVSRTQYQYTLEDADRGRARRRGRRGCVDAAARAARAARRRAAISRTSGLQAALDDRSRHRRRASASRRRRSTTRSTTPSASARSRRSSRSSTSTAWSSRSTPEFQQDPEALEQHLRAARPPARQVPLSAFTRVEPSDGAARDQPPGPVPGGHALVQPRARRLARRRGRAPSTRPSARSGCRASVRGELPGHRAGVPGLARQRAAADPRRAGHRLHRARRALRELHPPAHDPLDAAVGRRRRAPRAAALPAPSSSVIALIGIILLIGIVKKNAIMMIDFALEAERERGQVARRGDLPGLPAALPADHDDHDGGAARRRCRWRSARASGAELRRPLGITIVGGLICQPAPHALHHAGHLPRLRPARRGGCGAARAGAGGAEPSAGAADEHLRAVHPPAGRHDAADASALALAGVLALPAAAGRAAAAGRVPDDLRSRRSLPGASPETMASSVATPLERQFGRIAGVTEMTSTSSLGSTSDHAAVRPRPRHRRAPRATCRRRSTPRAASCRPNLPNNPDLPQGQPGRRADHDPGADLGHARPRARCTTPRRPILQQKLSQVEGVGQVIVGGGALPAVRVRARIRRRSTSYGIGARGRAHRARPRPTPTGPRAQLADGDQRLADRRQRPAASTPTSTGR